MKKIKQILFLIAVMLFMGACDKDFVEVNTDPFAITRIDPQLLFAGAERGIYLGGWETEQTIVQQFVNPFNDGATLGFNFNEDIDGRQNGPFGAYSGSLKEYVHILHLIETDEEYADMINLQSMVRIMKAWSMMIIVDSYSNAPYFNIGLAAIVGEEAWYPAYDDDEAIYDDLYTELKEAIGNLSASGEFVSADLFFGANGSVPSSDAATQVAKWKKLGNSILLRFGMRYSKVNPSKAESIVKEAVAGGVMTSNNDNAYVTYDGTNFTNGANGGLVNNQPKFYYAAEPFVDHLKATNDPRTKYLVAMFDDPGDPLGTEVPDVAIENQFGFPVGVERGEVDVDPEGLYRGQKGEGYEYSQMHVNVIASQWAPTIDISYAQTSLLLAEAAYRGWISGSAQSYYEAGIKADMDKMALYDSETGAGYGPISAEDQNAYLAQPGVAYNASNALELINTAYWIASITQGHEGWSNFRRSGYPDLDRNDYDDQLLANGNDGFVRRFTYPDVELSENKENYQAAVAAIGGSDDNVHRIFWDPN